MYEARGYWALAFLHRNVAVWYIHDRPDKRSDPNMTPEHDTYRCFLVRSYGNVIVSQANRDTENLTIAPLCKTYSRRLSKENPTAIDWGREREMMRKICELIEAKRQMKHLLARLQNAELCRNTKTTPIYNILIDSYCEMLLLILFVVAEGLFRE